LARSSASRQLASGDVIEALYTAAAGDLGWDIALGEMANHMGADVVAVFTEEPASRRPFACLTNASPDVQSVFATWSTVARHQDRVRAALDALPARTIRRSNDVPWPSRYRDSGFYYDYAARFGGTQMMDVDLARDRRGILNLCLWAVDRPAAFDERAVRDLEGFLPHVAKALRLERVLAREKLRHDFGLAVLETLSTPVFVIDADASVTFANAAAGDLTAADNGLQVKRGQIEATYGQRPSLTSRLRRLMAAPRAQVGIQTVTVTRSERRPLVLTLVLLPPASDLWAEAGSGQGAVVFVGDPDRELVGVGRDLQRTHGLTEREAQVATSLANGHDLASIARREAVGVDTVRKQLKQAFAKTGTSRQAELVRLVLLEVGGQRRALAAAD
jgi:DNA-binding CsgD family transcriptional regulator/PAS domain-containing protein